VSGLESKQSSVSELVREGGKETLRKRKNFEFDEKKRQSVAPSRLVSSVW
jgi:hypothetical protein